MKGAVWWGGERGGILGWSDGEEGAYRVLLPANRKVWLVEVPAEEQTVGKCGVVPLPRTDNRGRRIRNFELGSGVLEVRYRKAEGEGIPGCFVVLLVDRVSRFSRADHSGLARFEGLREGVFYVQGSAAGRSSCLLRKEFPEGETSERVELKLNPLQTLAGWVGASGQPLSGVPMRWTAYAHSGNVVGFGQATSDAAGNFSLDLCSEAAVVQVVAFPPGRSLMVRRIPVTPGGFLLIENPEGRASLELLGADVEQPSLPPWWIELPGGGQVAGLSAIQWAQANGARAVAGRVLIPALPSGTVGVGWADPAAAAEWDPLASWPPPGERCETVRLEEEEEEVPRVLIRGDRFPLAVPAIRIRAVQIPGAGNWTEKGRLSLG